MDTQSNPLPADGFIRWNNILGNKKKNIPAIVPRCRNSIKADMRAGRFPQQVCLSERVWAWKVSDIRSYLENPNQTWEINPEKKKPIGFARCST